MKIVVDMLNEMREPTCATQENGPARAMVYTFSLSAEVCQIARILQGKSPPRFLII